MKAIMDLHTHTLAAGHAYSTLLENIDVALAMGLQYLGMSEHGPTSPGGPHNFFFSNYKVIPRIYDREENTGRGGHHEAKDCFCNGQRGQNEGNSNDPVGSAHSCSVDERG